MFVIVHGSWGFLVDDLAWWLPEFPRGFHAVHWAH
jgi:hypothetical protein